MNPNPPFTILSLDALSHAYPDSYPSPRLSESDFISDADSLDLSSSQLWFNELLMGNQESEGSSSISPQKPNRKRKSSDPHRSIVPPMTRSNSSTIRLDTFSTYLINPSFLLYPFNRRSRRASCTSGADSHLFHGNGGSKAPKPLPEFNSRGLRLDPTDGTGWLDMNAYKDTLNAPPVVWKRLFFFLA